MKTKSKKAPVVLQEVYSGAEEKYDRQLLWILFLTLLMTGGALSAIQASWGNLAPSGIRMLLVAVLGIAGCALAYIRKEKHPAGWLYVLLPWAVLAVVTRLQGPVSGAKAWFNVLITRWNTINKGGVALFSVKAGEREILVFTLFLTLAVAQLSWIMISGYHVMWANLFFLMWLLLQLFCAVVHPIACGLLLSAISGMWISERNLKISRRGILWTMGILLVLCVLGGIIPSEEIRIVSQLRQSVQEEVHQIRYGEDTLPEGNLYDAGELQTETGSMLQVQSEQQKNLYLRGFVGAEYEDGIWSPLADSAYGDTHAGMLKWLYDRGFDPLTQISDYYTCSTDENKPEKNRVEVTATGASRYYAYTPVSLDTVREGRLSEKKDTRLFSKAFFGARKYAVDELSTLKPAELTVTNSWVNDPQTEEQQDYLEAEAVYRSFVYETYRDVDTETADLIRSLFWEDYESDSDGIYSAICQIRKVLKETVDYTENPEQTPEGEDPVRYFLTESQEGNSMLYASAAVDALRVHGIPARYVEGYYVSSEDQAKNDSAKITLTGKNAHAWVEAYFDGIGWLPLDVSPGYYYDAVALQKMVSSPEAVQKNAFLKNNSFGSEQVTGLEGNAGEGLGDRILPVVRNAAMISLGVAAVLLILLVLLVAAAEGGRGYLLWKDNRTSRTAAQRERIIRTEKKIYSYLDITGMEARLGWNTLETDRQLAERYEDMEEGEYSRVCDLIEKVIYGEVELEAYEERTVNSFLEKLLAEKKSVNWKNWLKYRYGYVWRNR